MELNLQNILLLTAIAWSGAIVYTIIASRQWSWWLALALITLAVSGIGWFYFPRQAGYVSGLLLLVEVIPMTMNRVLISAVNHGNFEKAHKAAIVMAALHPFDGYPLLLKVVSALRSAPSGDFSGANDLLEEIKRRKSPDAIQMTCLILRMQGRDAELIEYTDELARAGIPARILQQLSPYRIRSLAESGRMAEAFEAYREFKATCPQRVFEEYRYRGVDLCLAAFSGRVAHAEKLVGMLTKTGTTMHSIWMLTARKAAGEDVDNPLRELHAREPNQIYRSAIERRIESDLAGPASALSHENLVLLDRMHGDAGHKIQFGQVRDPNFKPRATHAVAYLILLVYLIEILTRSETSPARLLRMGALHANAVWAGQWWRAIGYNFLHFGKLHVFMNIFALVLLGPFVERSLGRVKYLVTYLGAGVCAALVYILLSPLGLTGRADILVGASGCIMGLVGATGAVLLCGWIEQTAPIARMRLNGIILIVIVQFVFDQSFPQVSSMIHMLGVAFGFLIAFGLYRGKAWLAKSQMEKST